MKKYTLEDFENFPIVGDIKQCPTGDYSNIEKIPSWCSFGEGCSFGEWCRFGERCRFGESCSFGERCRFGKGCKVCNHELSHMHVINISGVGDHKRTLYLWMTKDGVFCQAGCFFGDEKEFISAVKEKYGDNSDYEKALNFLKGINK